MKDEHQERKLDRRMFLKAAGLTAGALASTPFLTAFDHASFRDRGAVRGETPKRYQGNDEGQILESLDGGKTWQVTTDFGPECNVRKVHKGKDGLVAKVSYLNHPFSLKSQDGRNWYSMDWTFA